MSAKSSLSIRAAIMHCVARCVQSDAPLCCLGEFLESLQAMDWSAADIRVVELGVLRKLGRFGEQSVQSGKSAGGWRQLDPAQSGRFS